MKGIVKKYYKSGDRFFLWGSKYTELSKNEIDQWIQQKDGPEGTNSIYIAKIAMACPYQREHLIIVTDGDIFGSLQQAVKIVGEDSHLVVDGSKAIGFTDGIGNERGIIDTLRQIAFIT